MPFVMEVSSVARRRATKGEGQLKAASRTGGKSRERCLAKRRADIQIQIALEAEGERK